MNLSINTFLFSEPMPPKLTVDEDYNELIRAPRLAVPGKFSCWDRIDLHGPMTIEEIFEELDEEYDVTCTGLSMGNTMLVNDFMMGAEKKKERMAKDPITVAEEILNDKRTPWMGHATLEVTATKKHRKAGEEEIRDVDVGFPTVVYHFKSEDEIRAIEEQEGMKEEG